MRHEPSPLATGLWPNEARGPENDTAPTDPSKSAPVEQRLKHVLVVDDDPALRAMVANYLVDQNVRVSTASNGREMARVLTAGGVDLVIIDLKLGNENGLEIVRALRAESDLPIIVLTGQHLDEIDGVVGLELGADVSLSPSVRVSFWRASARCCGGRSCKCDSQNGTPSGRGTSLPVGCSACGTVV